MFFPAQSPAKAKAQTASADTTCNLWRIGTGERMEDILGCNEMYNFVYCVCVIKSRFVFKKLFTQCTKRAFDELTDWQQKCGFSMIFPAINLDS